MKKTTIILSLLLASCAPLSPRDSQSQREYTKTRPQSLLIDLCMSENMPHYRTRPKLRTSELANMSEREMDNRIRHHIAAMEKHIDSLEDVITLTRRRVELCQ